MPKSYTSTFFPAQLREKRKCFHSCKSVIKVKVWLLGVRNATTISITAVKAGKNLNIPKGTYEVGELMLVVSNHKLLMLFSGTLNCQKTKIFMNSGCQLSELKSVSQMSEVPGLSLSLPLLLLLSFCCEHC